MNNALKNINETLFITSEMNAQREHYRWSPPKELETRFGVEIEACIKINPECIKIENNNTKTRINILRNMHVLTFKDKFDLYYQSIITKSKHFEDLSFKYNYLVIISWGDGFERTMYYYDMTNPDQPGMTREELLKFELQKEGLNEFNKYNPLFITIQEKFSKLEEKAINYELPIFLDDKSIVCGEDKWPSIINREKAGVPDDNSFRFECVTPILSIKGYPTKKKIGEVLYPLLSLYGLNNPDCFIQNYSMGFHVNASLYNTRHDKYLAIAESPFLNYFLRNYIKLEKNIYAAVRPRGMERVPANYFTKFNQPNFRDYARPLYRNLEHFKRIKMNTLNTLEDFGKYSLANVAVMGAEEPNTNKNEIINKIMTKHDYMDEKYKGVKRKSPFLLEFRLFEGESDIRKLIAHVFTALDILHKTANEVAEAKGKLEFVENGNNDSISIPNYNSQAANEYYGGTRKTIKRHYKSKRKTLRRK